MADGALIVIRFVLAALIFAFAFCVGCIVRLKRRMDDLEDLHERFVRQTHNELVAVETGFRLLKKEEAK